MLARALKTKTGKREIGHKEKQRHLKDIKDVQMEKGKANNFLPKKDMLNLHNKWTSWPRKNYYV